MFGLLNVNKPVGPTSHDIVAAVRRMLPRKTKVGHAGTLDPFADGVLVICVGSATRLAEYVQAQPKRYTAEITLGANSTTDDIQGEISQSDNITEPTKQAVVDALAKFVGEIQQIPPAHSAVHINGQRAYKLARAGEEVNLTARAVTIYDITLLEFNFPTIKLDIKCGSGTYIRSIARDIGVTLGVGGYCKALTRSAVGAFKLKNARTPQELDPTADLLPATLAVDNMSRITLQQSEADRLALGQRIRIDSSAKPDAAEVAVFDEAGELIALGTFIDDGLTLQPTKVLSPRSD